MLNLPWELLTSGVLVDLSIRDLQAVNVAFTSTPTHRAQIKELWKSYPYECPDGVSVTLDDLKWMRSVNMYPVRVVMLHTVRKDVVSIVSYITLRFPTSLRKFEVDFCPCTDFIFNDALLIRLAQGCPHLEVMYIPYSSVTDAGMLAFAQNCRQLHTLNMKNSFHITDASIEAICSHCPHLKHIAISNCRSLTDASLIAIANSYPHLLGFSLFSDNFTDAGLISIANMCHELRAVTIWCYAITNRGLTALWAANPNLMDVNISENEVISDNDIIPLAQCCPVLQTLNMSSCYDITDAAVIAVAEHCPQLRSLDISECNEMSDASLIALGQHSHELKSINISVLKNISDVGIAALAAGCPLLQEFYAGDTNITDAGVIALARGCRDLLKIDMSACKLIGFRAISAIAKNRPLISELRLSYCPNIDDACLYAIAKHCLNLTFLDVSVTAKASLHGVCAVLLNCQKLRKIFHSFSYLRLQPLSK